MGTIISEMSDTSQIICITHLPQIASKGHAHYKVFKDEKEGKVQTSMLKLIGDERILEIAQLLSGAKTTDAALANARELLHLN
jgi:DNA repair protein RecN (Recombination protein N)